MKTPPPITEVAGAGLPTINAFVVRYFIFPVKYRSSSVAGSLNSFHQGTSALVDRVNSLSEEQLNTKVLIFPLQGLEDSSRNWSIAETFEHLYVTHSGMTQIATSLMNGIVPDMKISTANVKPSGKRRGRQMVQAFREFIESRRTKDSVFANLSHGGAKLFHPWFGNLCAKEWIFLRTFHQEVHRKQIESIIHSSNF